MDNDIDVINKNSPRKYPKKGILAVFSALLIIGMLLMPYGPSPTGGVSATWTEYGSYISTISTIAVYDDEGELLMSWTKNTHNSIFDIPLGTTIGNVTVTCIIRSTELVHESTPETDIDFNIWFIRDSVLVDKIYDMSWYTYNWLDSDDWYGVAYFHHPGIMDDWTIDADVNFEIGVEFKMYVP